MESREIALRVSRKLRYSEIDIEAERAAGRLAPDELFVPQHIINTNISREQSAYVQYITQSPRACILLDDVTPSNDTSALERDFSNRVRYDGWQQPLYRTIDAFQQDGYSVAELILDQTKLGELAVEAVPMSDLGFVTDTKDIQSCEQIVRKYWFTKTALLGFTTREEEGGRGWSKVEVDNVIGNNSANDANATTDTTTDGKDKSLFAVEKVMFRVKGVVQVGWSCERTCDEWLRAPRPLYIGRQKQNTLMQRIAAKLLGKSLRPYSNDVEKLYPYYLFQYTISENPTITDLKGRVYLDQDTQEAASSLMSSYVTAHRRAAGLYFSKDSSDPNDDVLMQKNVYFRTGALINSKVTQFQLDPPDSSMLGAIQGLVTANQAESSQVNFAVNNRKDSRKTATEINAANQQASQLTTIQVTLFATALRQLYQTMFDIIQSRVKAQLIEVTPELLQMYAQQYIVKPSGDTDVIERQQKIQMMMQSWPVIQNTPAAVPFLCKLLSILFPDDAAQYIQIIQASQQQGQQMQQLMAMLQQFVSNPAYVTPAGQQAVQQVIASMQQQSQSAGGEKGTATDSSQPQLQ